MQIDNTADARQKFERKIQLLEEINGDDLKDLYLENVDDRILEGAFFTKEFLYSDSMYEVKVGNLFLNNIDEIVEKIQEEKLQKVIRDVLEIFKAYGGNMRKNDIKYLKLGIKQKGILKIENTNSKNNLELAIRIDTLSKLNKTFSLSYNVNNVIKRISNYFRS